MKIKSKPFSFLIAYNRAFNRKGLDFIKVWITEKIQTFGFAAAHVRDAPYSKGR